MGDLFTFKDTLAKWSAPLKLIKRSSVLIKRRPEKAEQIYTIQGILRFTKHEKLQDKPGKKAPHGVATLRVLAGPLDAIDEGTQLPTQVTIIKGDQVELANGYRLEVDTTDPTLSLYSDVEAFYLTEVVVKTQP